MINKEKRLRVFYKRSMLICLITSFFSFAQKNYEEQIPGNDYRLQMQFITGGNFKMGSSKSEFGHFGDEGPQHEVTVDGFWMSQREVTWDLYNLFVSRELDGNQITKQKLLRLN